MDGLTWRSQMQLLSGDMSEGAIARWQLRYEQLMAERKAEFAEHLRRMEPVCAVCARLIRDCGRDHLPAGLTGMAKDCR
jgi:hypothetical protein